VTLRIQGRPIGAPRGAPLVPLEVQAIDMDTGASIEFFKLTLVVDAKAETVTAILECPVTEIVDIAAERMAPQLLDPTCGELASAGSGPHEGRAAGPGKAQAAPAFQEALT